MCVFVSVVEGVYVCVCWCKGKVCVKVECVKGVKDVCKGRVCKGKVK